MSLAATQESATIFIIFLNLCKDLQSWYRHAPLPPHPNVPDMVPHLCSLLQVRDIMQDRLRINAMMQTTLPSFDYEQQAARQHLRALAVSENLQRNLRQEQGLQLELATTFFSQVCLSDQTPHAFPPKHVPPPVVIRARSAHALQHLALGTLPARIRFWVISPASELISAFKLCLLDALLAGGTQ